MKNFRLIGVLLLTATFVFVSCGADPTNFGTIAHEFIVVKTDYEVGNYQLLCNIAAHYANGMHAAFIVE
jgi:hypothetical protein